MATASDDIEQWGSCFNDVWTRHGVSGNGLAMLLLVLVTWKFLFWADELLELWAPLKYRGKKLHEYLEDKILY